MTVTIRTLAAIWRISKYLMHADGSVTDDEIKPVYDFFKTFGEMNDEIFLQIMREAEDLSNCVRAKTKTGTRLGPNSHPGWARGAWKWSASQSPSMQLRRSWVL